MHFRLIPLCVFCMLLCGFAPTAEAVSSKYFLRSLRERTIAVRTIALNNQFIPSGAQRVPLLRLAVDTVCDGRTGGEAARIWEIEVEFFGLGDTQFIRGVYLMSGTDPYKGLQRVSRPVAVSSDDRRVTLRPHRNVEILCNQRAYFDVVVDISASAPVGSQYFARVASPASFATNATVLGDFPLVNRDGGTQTTPSQQGRLSLEAIPPNALSVGEESIVAKVRATAEGRHYMLRSMKITNEGTASHDDIYRLYISTARQGRPLTEIVSHMNDDEVFFYFPRAYFIEQGKSVMLHVIGTPKQGYKTVAFTIKELSDVDAVPVRLGGRWIGGQSNGGFRGSWGY